MEIGSFWEETQLPDNNSRHSTQSWGSIYQIWCICSDSNIRLLHRVQLGELLCWLEKKKICCLKGGINRIMEFYIWLIVELPRVTNYTYSMVWKGLLVMVSKSDFVFLFMPWLEKLLLAQMQINASFSFLQTLQWFSNKMSTYNR